MDRHSPGLAPCSVEHMGVCVFGGGGGHVFPGEVKEGSTRGIELGLSGRAQHEGWGLGTVLQGILLTH